MKIPKIKLFKNGLFIIVPAIMIFMHSNAHSAPSWNSGNVSGDFTMNGGDNANGISIGAGNSLNINSSGAPVNSVVFNANSDISVAGDFLHNAGLAGVASGGFSILGDDTKITAVDTINIEGQIIIGDGTNSNTITMKTNSFLAKKLTVNSGAILNLDSNIVSIEIVNLALDSKTTIFSDYSDTETLNSQEFNLSGDLYMGTSASSSDSLVIQSSDAENTYTISGAQYLDIGGNVSVDTGTLILAGGDINIGGNTSGDLDFDAGTINIAGDLLSSGKINSAGDIIIGGDAIGNLEVVSGGDLWVGQNLAGDLNILADNIDVLGDFGNAQTISNIDANKISISGDVLSDGAIVSSGNIEINGTLANNTDKLVITGNDINIGGNTSGDLDFDAGALSVGNAVLNSDTSLAWADRLTNLGLGDLLSDGSIESAGDIIIGGSVDGNLDITSGADMWVGKNLLGYWSLDVANLYVLGNVNGGGNITAGEIFIGGDLSGNINIDTGKLTVERDIMGGTVFRPNLPGAFDGFHINPDTGNSGPFKQIDMDVHGTYFFNDDSYLQLVLNQKIADSDGNSGYDSQTDRALISVGGFDASDMTRPSDYTDMDSVSNIEILMDNMSGKIKKIKIIEITNGGLIDTGMLDFAGVWIYSDDNNDGTHDRRLFQESKITIENNNIYANLLMLSSVEKLTIAANSDTSNDGQMAAAIDDLIITRVRKYSGYDSDNLSDYYTSVLRILFPENDIYNKLILNGGNHTDALDVMVAENPNLALSFVRDIDISDIANIGNNLTVSSIYSRNAVSDQLMDDFTWVRYRDKSVAWARGGLGDSISSLSFGADTKIKNFIAGFNIGYNDIGFNSVNGSTINLGLYGTYKLNDIARLYGSLNIAMHSANVLMNNSIIGNSESKISATDSNIEFGILHKIFDQYITGRAHVVLGVQGGYSAQQQYHGADFMDINADSNTVFAPGYELSLGKDIWFSTNVFIRPQIKIGAEYNLMGGGRAAKFKFSESNVWRQWDMGASDALWLRYGLSLDFSFIMGTSLGLGYEVLKNSDFQSNQIKLYGTYRF